MAPQSASPTPVPPDQAPLGPFLAAASAMAHDIAALGPRQWFLDCDTDADGLCAAAVMTAALRHAGHRVHVRPSRDKDTRHYAGLAEAPGDALMLLDKGSSHGDRMPAGRPVFIVDHHNVPGTHGDDVRLLNPRACGLDGSRDASASTTAFALARALVGTVADRWIPVALAGAVGDWQHRPAWAGWNRTLVDESRQLGLLASRQVPRLLGADLGDAAARWGLSAEQLDGLGLDPGLEPSALEQDAATRVVSALVLAGLARGDPPRALRRLVAEEDHDVRLGASLRTVFRIADACGRLGHAGTGLGYLLGDPAATAEAQAHFDTYRGMLSEALAELPSAVEQRGAIQWAWTRHPALSGMVAGIALESGRIDATMPICVLARRPDGAVQASTRALQGHVADGLDLGVCTATAAKAAGAEGGGHPVAAGAVLPDGSHETFLDALSESVARLAATKT